MSFKGFMADFGDGRPPLARQTSIYSLTFDEWQSTMGGPGKDFGSMNMDELLKSIWSAEESQTNPMPADVFNEGHVAPLQRQRSLTLPRTMSQKTVDEVWRNLSANEAHTPMPPRQQTLGEMTLEEFLMRAGVVREDGPTSNCNKPGGGSRFFGELARSGNGGFGFQQQDRGTNNQLGNLSPNLNPNLPLNVNGVRSNQQPQQQVVPQQIFPKQQPVSYANMQLGSNVIVPKSPVLQGGMGNFGSGGGNGRVAAISPANQLAVSPVANQLSSDRIGIGIGNGNRKWNGKSNGTDTSSVSPMPYVFGNGFRGRKGGPVEKVVERRQRRMIKNRESAARSIARKQAYTMELEAEIAKLKEENQDLKKNEEKLMEMQKNQDMEIENLQRGKRRCLRRAHTGSF